MNRSELLRKVLKDNRRRRTIMLTHLEKLAEEIVASKEEDQRRLLEEVARFNYQRGLQRLSKLYRDRLKKERKLGQTAEDILKELRGARERVADREYPG